MAAYRPAPQAPAPLESGQYDELTAVARRLGVPHRGASTLAFDDEGGRTQIELSFNSGTVDGFAVVAFSHPFPEVTLRDETDVDRRGKEKGINLEIQLGDPQFDPRVYIETDAYDQAVRALLASPWIRSAVLALLKHCMASRVEFGPRGVSVHVHLGTGSPIQPERVLEILPPLHVLRGAPFVPLVDRPRRRTEWSIGMSAVACGVGLVAFILVLPTCAPSSIALPFLGAGAGLGAFVLAWLGLRLGVRGHSRAYRHYVVAVILSLFACLFWGPVLAMFANVAFDDSKPTEERGKVITVSKDDDGEAVVVGEFGKDRSSAHFGVPAADVCVGDRLVRRKQGGALGFPYHGTTTWTSTVPRPCK